MKNKVWGLGLLAAGLIAVYPARGQDNAKAATPEPTPAAPNEIRLQTTCPVMGGAIDRNQYVDHDGKRVYICCKGCEAPLKKDPEKYIRKMEADGITVARLQSTCPVMGGAINKALYVDHDGKRIYVCCQGCIPAVRQDPAKYIAAMEKAGVVLAPAAEP